MKRTQNRKETVRRERIVAVLSSVFILAALVCVGIYMKGQTGREQSDGYEIDFAALENDVSDKYHELEQSIGKNGELLSADDAMDYMPREDVLTEGIYTQPADSGKVEIGKLQENIQKLAKEVESMENQITGNADSDLLLEDEIIQESDEKFLGEPVFAEANGFYRPVEGEIMMHFDMEHTVYFATLDQYKYNPATIIRAAEGQPVYACANATVKTIYSNEEIGTAMVLDLGNGYEAVYGQLRNIQYQEGEKVGRGDQIAEVAAPTIYYTLEGSNLYFSLKKEGEVINAETMLPMN
jgi:murein DD-endopeptidase MepM/ murein hydrolase activator NlpD